VKKNYSLKTGKQNVNCGRLGLLGSENTRGKKFIVKHKTIKGTGIEICVIQGATRSPFISQWAMDLQYNWHHEKEMNYQNMERQVREN